MRNGRVARRAERAVAGHLLLNLDVVRHDVEGGLGLHGDEAGAHDAGGVLRAEEAAHAAHVTQLLAYEY